MRAAVVQQWILIMGLAGLVARISPAQTTLVSTGSVWKYLDDGSDQGTAWQGILFDDTAWAAGPAQLGYGDGDEATIVNGGPITNRFVTTYFRQVFPLAPALQVTNLAVRLLRGHGGIVYLNGTEVFRSNMPTNEINSARLASGFAPASDQTTNFYAKRVDPSLLLPVNILAVEIHQFSQTSSNLSFDLALVGNFAAARPTVRITAPTNSTALVASDLMIAAEAHDEDDAITLVEFFDVDTKLGEAATPPYGLPWSHVPQGSHTLTAVATDSHSLSSTSAPVKISVPDLVPGRGVWKYLDDGSDEGTAWRSLSFDDRGWANGPALLGYGVGDEATVINGGPPTDRFITYYFRYGFEVSDPAAFSNLVLRLVRDHGGVVYLNGAEVFRSNMPDGVIDYLTWAASFVDGPQESEFYSTRLDPALLVAGQNLLAVEIHQANNTSSHVRFDLQLLPNVPPTPPVVTITSPAPFTPGLVAPATLDIEVAATDFDSTVTQVKIYLRNTPVGLSTVEPFGMTLTNVVPGDYTICAVATDASGMTATSSLVAISIAGAPIITSLIATGSVWKYLDTGSANQGTAWKEVGFDDGSWAAGPGILGYGNAVKIPPRPEATHINCCKPSTMYPKYITDYFRREFVVGNPSGFTNLWFGVLRDDGVVVYLNGTEIFRMNMPSTNPITYATVSSTVVGGTNETFYFPTNISPALLIEGTNLLAVELHQSGPSTTDAAFDLRLDAISSPATAPISLTIENTGSEVVLRWSANGVVLEECDDLGWQWAPVTSAPSSPYRIGATNTSRFYRLRQPYHP